MELIVLNLGMDLGVISPTVFTMLVTRRISRAAGTTLTLFHVVAPGDPDRPLRGREQIANALHDLTASSKSGQAALQQDGLDQIFEEPGAASGTVHVRRVEHASPPDAVLEECQRGYDLVVLGMHARWGLGAGTISLRRQRVLAEAPVSILAVHPPVSTTQPAAAPEPRASLLAGSPA